MRDEGEYLAFSNSWDVGWHMPKDGGIYFDMYSHPLDVDDIEERLKTYRWPDANNPALYKGMLENAMRGAPTRKIGPARRV